MRRLLTALLLCIVMPAAFAQHSIKRLDIKVTLMKDGSAKVVEKRKVKVTDEGTEGYITFNNMGDIQVKDLAVSDEEGTEFVVEQEWDTQRSRSEKEGRCGYHKTNEGVELCWGIGDAGKRTYEIHYTLTNLVKAYDDYDGFCYSFYEAANSPAKKASVEIEYENDSLSIANAAVWAFGFYGNKGFDGGVCRVATSQPMMNGDAIIVLLQLKKGVLAPVAKPGGSFTETVKRPAFVGSDYNLEDAGLADSTTSQAGGSNKVGGMSQLMDGGGDEEADDGSGPSWELVTVLTIVIGIVVAAFISTRREEKRAQKEHERLTAHINELLGGARYDDMPYYRNLPLGGNLLLSGTTLATLEALTYGGGLAQLGLRYSIQQICEAFILRMLYKKQIQLTYDSSAEHTGNKLFRISEPVKPEKGDDITELPALKRDYKKYWQCELESNEALFYTEHRELKDKFQGYINDAGVEYFLQKMLYNASGADHLLQPDELKNYVKQNPLEWRPLATLLNRLTGNTMSEDRLKKDNVQQVVGFMHYLKDFSLVAERNIEETSLWKEYLVFASFYGIADQVRKDMKKVAPDVANIDDLLPSEEIIDDFEPLTEAVTASMFLAQAFMTEKEIRTVAERHARQAERELERERSSGGSGSSSYEGGGGHSGGGGSGFR